MKRLVILLIMALLLLVGCTPDGGISSGYVIGKDGSAAHMEYVCTDATYRVCLSYDYEQVPAFYEVDITSCGPDTNWLGNLFCSYNTLSVSSSQYDQAKVGKYIDLSQEK